MTLGEKLLYLRKNKGLSQEQLAAHVTVSRQAVSKWELGESLPDTENVIQLTKIFNVSADFLLNDEIDISIGSTENVNQDKDVIPFMLEKEIKDDTDLLALKTCKQRTNNKIWIPLLSSVLVIVLIVGLYFSLFL